MTLAARCTPQSFAHLRARPLRAAPARPRARLALARSPAFEAKAPRSPPVAFLHRAGLSSSRPNSPPGANNEYTARAPPEPTLEQSDAAEAHLAVCWFSSPQPRRRRCAWLRETSVEVRRVQRSVRVRQACAREVSVGPTAGSSSRFGSSNTSSRRAAAATAQRRKREKRGTLLSCPRSSSSNVGVCGTETDDGAIVAPGRERAASDQGTAWPSRRQTRLLLSSPVASAP